MNNEQNPLIPIAEAARAYLDAHPRDSKVKVTIYQSDDRYVHMEFLIPRGNIEEENEQLDGLYTYAYGD